MKWDAPKYSPANKQEHYTAWSSMNGTLIPKNLVEVNNMGNKGRFYRLT